MICPKCGSDRVQVQLVSEIRKRGCLSVLLYLILLCIPVIGWIALALCVPHAAVVSPGFLVPLLWPLAIVVPILGYCFVDYPLARALGGAAILGAYYLVHKSFELHTPCSGAIAVLAWIFGIAGIWVSGKPCALRDWIRLCARSGVWRGVSGGFWVVFALALFWGALLTRGE